MKNEQFAISVDALLAMAMAEVEREELAALPSLEAMNEAFRPSAEFEEKMHKLLRGVKRQEKRRRNWKVARRAMTAAAACLALFTCTMLPARAVREAVVETLIEWQDKFATLVFSLQKEECAGQLPGKVELLYLPQGYQEKESVLFDSADFTAVYEGSGGDLITVSVSAVSTKQTVDVDNEFSQYYLLEFDGNKAVWMHRQDGSNLLIWNDDSLLYQVSGPLDLSELVKIGQNITFS